MEEINNTPAVETPAENEVQAAPEEGKRFNRRGQKDARGARGQGKGPRRGGRVQEEKEFEERVVKINRVTKVVKGGRRYRFAALVVIGDKKGRVGFGTGKANEVPDAIRKATEEAKRNLIVVPMVGTTLPHEMIGNYGAGSVLVRPAAEGTGVIAGGPVRAVLELAGVTDVISKCLGSRTAVNVVTATINGLKNMTTIEKVAATRGKKPQEIRY